VRASQQAGRLMSEIGYTKADAKAAVELLASFIDSCAADNPDVTRAFRIISLLADDLPDPGHKLIRFYVPNAVYEIPELKQALVELKQCVDAANVSANENTKQEG